MSKNKSKKRTGIPRDQNGHRHTKEKAAPAGGSPCGGLIGNEGATGVARADVATGAGARAVGVGVVQPQARLCQVPAM